MSDVDIIKAMDDGEIRIEGFTRRMLQPASVEVHLGEEFGFYASGKSTVLDPYELTEESLAISLFTSVQHPVFIDRHQFVLAHTQEKVALSNGIAARLEGKSTLGRLGLNVHVTAGYIDPGFHGQITLELVNHNARPIRLKAGMPIGQLAFQRVTSASVPYGNRAINSHYQGQTGVGIPRSLRS